MITNSLGKLLVSGPAGAVLAEGKVVEEDVVGGVFPSGLAGADGGRLSRILLLEPWLGGLSSSS